MKRILLAFFFSFIAVYIHSQEKTTTINGYLVPACIYEGDTIASIHMPTLYCFKPLVFKNKQLNLTYEKTIHYALPL